MLASDTELKEKRGPYPCVSVEILFVVVFFFEDHETILPPLATHLC